MKVTVEDVLAAQEAVENASTAEELFTARAKRRELLGRLVRPNARTAAELRERDEAPFSSLGVES